MQIRVSESNVRLFQDALAHIRKRFKSPPAANRLGNDLLEAALNQIIKKFKDEEVILQKQPKHD